MKIDNTNYYSKKIGTLARGCQYCVKGSKLVLFITGLCPRNCYYCPISDKKHQQDVVYADEWPTKDIPDIIKEAEMIDAEGAGITGGDPLCKIDRTVEFIIALKKKFNKRFHIHLYTSFDLVDHLTLKRLFDAGLDEIRFHADIENDKLWNKIDLVNQFKWDVGIEIPVIPGKLDETKKLINYFNNKIKFINLNELESADNEFSKLGEMGFHTKDNLSYGIKGSEEMALELLKHISQNFQNLNAHYCTARLKDGVQLANRIKRRAQNAAKRFDKITKEGLLYRGAIYTFDTERTALDLGNKYHLKKEMYAIDELRGRILVGSEWLFDHKEDLKYDGYKIALVEEYPTYDCLNIVTDFL